MLQTIRDKAQGIVAYIIVGLLIIPFALFGMYNYFTGGSNPAVATVNGIEITRSELDAAVQRQQSQLRQALGDQYNAAMFDEGRLRPQVLDRLIDQAVLLSFVREHGLRVTDEALRSVVRSQPYFRVDGEFSRDRYQAVLRQNGYSADQYEAQLRQEQLLRQLELGIAGTSVITEQDIEQFVALEHQLRDLAWLKVDAAKFRGQSDVVEKAIQQYYDAHKQAFTQPEQVRISYIELSKNALAGQLTLEDKAVRQFYEEVKSSRFTIPGARRVRHILIKLAKDASKQQVAAGREQIAGLRRQIEQGGSFAELARRHSQDTGSAREGGDLGFVRRGEMVESVEQTAFRLKEGEVSEPVRSRFGWHLIKVVDVRPETSKPYSAVESQLREELLERQLAKRFYELSNEVANYAYEHPESLEPAAEKFDLQIQQSGWFSQVGAREGIGSHPEVVKAAFSDDVLKDGLNSQSIALGDERQVVLRVDQHKPAAVRPIEEVRHQIREHLIAADAAERARALGERLLSKARESGESLESLAAGEEYVQHSSAGWVQRATNKVPTAIAERGFRLAHPSGDKSTLAGISLPNGDYAVLEVRGVRDGALDNLKPAERTRVRQGLHRLESESTLQTMIHVLRQQADVTLDRKLTPESGES